MRPNIVLQRLADPYRPHDPTATSSAYNPYVTVDSVQWKPTVTGATGKITTGMTVVQQARAVGYNATASKSADNTDTSADSGYGAAGRCGHEVCDASAAVCRCV